MTKGINTLFVAAIALLGVANASATAPVISTIPDVIIGDAENNGPSDNNFFVFTDAFNFDDYVTDDLTADVNLKWSFDEGDPATPASGWYQINGKTPVHVGTAAQVGDTSSSPSHVNPAAANELRGVSATASFRDVVFSPTPGTGPFPDPTEPDESAHATGKVVTFYVSDGTLAASKDILVKTIDNGFDGLTVDAPAFTPFRDDTFDTNGTGTMWVTGGGTASNTAYNQFSHSAGAYRINVTAQPGKFRIAYWNNQRLDWMPYSSVGTANYVRAKYYIYNSGSNTTGGAGVYSVPNFNLKLSQRFAVSAVMTIQTHDAIATDLPYYKDLAPSTNPALPSMYRMDFDPVDVPFMTTRTPAEGIQSSFEIFSLSGEDNGMIAMTEEEIGTYPASALSASKASQVYDNALLTNASTVDQDLEYDMSTAAAPGDYPTSIITPGAGTMTNSAAGVTFDTTAVGAYPRVALIERTFFGGTNDVRMRIAENEQYKVRFHLASTRPYGTQSTIWLKARAAKFGQSNYLQLGGGTLTGPNGEIAREATVGAGSLNPDGGWYTLLVNTPLDLDIRPDASGNLATRMPTLGNPTLPGRGVNAASPYRDIRVSVSAYDTLTLLQGIDTPEAAQFTVDRIELDAYDRVADGGY